MNYKRRKQLTIRTPEGVEFSFLLAGPVSRCLALTIDFFVKIVIMNVAATISNIFKIISIDFSASFLIISYFIVSICYSITLEWCWQGQTLGKRLFRLRVIDAQGLRLHFSQVVIRNLLHVIDMLPVFYLVGGLSCILSNKAQRLGDLAANTIVIYVPKIEQPELDQLLKGKYNSLRRYPHLCSRLRQNVSPDEAEIAMQAIIRRDDFDPSERIKLFEEIAQYFKTKVIFPDEDIENVSDEQYVRNVVDILFSSTQREWAESKVQV
ncbi:MAG: RDD family protein [Candidatus Omnitrophica bacterium]|nr:RDD family protein [Candidatus Omnitrophota bacterium]